MVDIPVNESTAQTLVTITANGQELVSFDFLAFDGDQVRATFRPLTGAEVELSEGVDYTVSGLNQPNGGDINLIGIDTVIGDQVMMFRETPIEREKDWQNEGDYKADLVNSEQDEIYMIMQELRRDTDRAAKVPLGEEGAVIYPGAAGTVAVWDGDGNLIEGPAVSDAVNSQFWAGKSREWARNPVSTLVDDGVNPPDYSSYHYAQASAASAAEAEETLQTIITEIGEVLPRAPARFAVGAGVQSVDLGDDDLSGLLVHVNIDGAMQFADQWSLIDGILTPVGDPWPGDGVAVNMEVTFTPTIATAIVVVPDGSVTEQKIADNAVTPDKLSDDVLALLPQYYLTKAALEGAFVPSNVFEVNLRGYDALGDGGAARWKRRDTSIPTGISSNGGTVHWELDEEVIRPLMLGIKGDGSNENTALNNMAAFAVGKSIKLSYARTYGITAFALPEGTTLDANRSVFRKMASSASFGLSIAGNSTIDEIVFSSPGGVGDNGVRVAGSNINVGLISSISDSAASAFGINITNGVTEMVDCHFRTLVVGNYRSSIQAYGLQRCQFDDIRFTGFVTGLYIRDVKNTDFRRVSSEGTNPNADGGQGNNAILVESYTADYSCMNLTFGQLNLSESAEHNCRIGGSFIVANLHIEKLTSKRSGNLGNVSTGGAAFKCLLNDANPGRHENITVDSLYFEDAGIGSGAFGNHTAIQMHKTSGGYIANLIGRAKNQPYSCTWGIGIESCNNFRIINPDVEGCKGSALHFFKSALPGDRTLSDCFVEGGRLTTATPTLPVVDIECSDVVFTQFGLIGNCQLRGGKSAVRFVDPGVGGGYSDPKLVIDYDYNQSSGAGGAIEGFGASVCMMNVRGPMYGVQNARNGSIYQDRTSGKVFVRTGGAWVDAAL